MTNTHYKLTLAAVAAAVTVLPALSVQAAEYVVRPYFIQQLSWNDNLQLNASEELEVESGGLRLRPGASVTVTGDDWRARVNGSLDFFRFEESDFDTDDQHLDLNLIKTSEKARLQLDTRYSRRSVRTSEFDFTGGLGERSVQSSRIENATVRPVFQYQFSQRNSLATGFTYSSVQYDTLRYSDYTNLSLDVAWSHVRNERLLLTTTAFASSYDAEDLGDGCGFESLLRFGGNTVNLESETLGAQFGARFAWTPKLTASTAIGWRNVQSQGDGCVSFFGLLFPSGRSSDEDGIVADADIAYQGERIKIDFALDRSVTPAGLGFMIETNSATLGTEYRLTERFTAGLSLNRFESEAVESSSDYFRDYYSAEASGEWRLTQKLRLRAQLRYREQEASYTAIRDAVGRVIGFDTAEGINAVLELRYTPNPIQFGR